MFHRLMLRSVSRQLLLAVLCVALVIGAARSIEVLVDRPYPNLGDKETFIERATVIDGLLRQAPPSSRLAIVAWAKAAGLTLELLPTDDPRIASAPDYKPGVLVTVINLIVPPDVVDPPGSRAALVDGEASLLMPQPDGLVLVVHNLPTSIHNANVVGPFRYYLLAFIVLAIVYGTYFRFAFLGPLTRLSMQVQRSNVIEDGGVLTERGPMEVVALTEALNAMRHRVRELLEARARMLRGVSHDLRTPLTRLRQRVERLEPGEGQGFMLADIGRIDRLIEETLDYLRTDASGEARERVDVASLLQTVQAEFADSGSAVDYIGPERMVATVAPHALMRAVTNLCSNGLKFGSRVTVALSAGEAGRIRIDVADDGPGIPVHLRQRVLEPFFKADPTRPQHSGSSAGGFGLGLSIVVEIVTAHGGSFALLDNAPRGTLARMDLPVLAQ